LVLQATLSAQLQAALKLGPNALKITRHLADEAGLNYGALEAEGGGRIWHPTKVQLNFKFEGTDAIELGNEIEQQVPYLHCFAHAHNIARSAFGRVAFFLALVHSCDFGAVFDRQDRLQRRLPAPPAGNGGDLLYGCAYLRPVGMHLNTELSLHAFHMMANGSQASPLKPSSRRCR
jgi:hypothetical protein